MGKRSGLRLTVMAATLSVAAACATEPVVVVGTWAPDDALQAQGALQEAVGGERAVPGNRVTILRDGSGTFQAMFAALAAARDHINLEYYIFDDVHWQGQSVGDLLAAKLAAGVAVDVIYDGYGSSGADPGFLDRLRQAGARLVVFGPIGPGTLHNPNDRDHRKIMIIDGRTAFVGGVNLDRVYENPRIAGNGNDDPSAAYWRDTDARIDGPAVAALQRLFMQTWKQANGPELPARDWFPPVPADGGQTVRIIGSVPSDDRSLYYLDRLSAEHAVRRSISLSTGYFVPAHQEVEELERAARRGVRVRLILPAQSDSKSALAAGRAAYGDLLAAGVEIYEMPNAVLHSKLEVIDGVWTAIGSSNLDHRSAVFNNEVDAIVLGRETANTVEALLDADTARSTRIALQAWRNRPFIEREHEFFVRFWEWWL